MRDQIALAMALFGIVNIAAGSWGVIYLIENGYAGAPAYFLCAIPIAIGIGPVMGAAR